MPLPHPNEPQADHRPTLVLLPPPETAPETTTELPTTTDTSLTEPETAAPASAEEHPEPDTTGSRAPQWWTTRPPSLAERWEHSQHGDWAANPNSLQRVGHIALTILTFIPAAIAWLLNEITTPARLVIATALVVIAYAILA